LTDDINPLEGTWDFVNRSWIDVRTSYPQQRREHTMTEQSESRSELKDEFRRLGENLSESLKALWEYPETKQFRTEMKDGLIQLGDTLSQAVHDFSESPEGQQLQASVEDLGEKIHSGEVEAKARQELIHALNRINIELEKVKEQLVESDVKEEEGDPED
jgi:signal recognition particle GTPase